MFPSSMENVKIRRWPKVPLAVSTVRAFSSSGRVVGTIPAAACSFVARGTAAFARLTRRCSFATEGAKSVSLICLASSVRRSSPTRCDAGAFVPVGRLALASPPVTSAALSNTRHGMRVSRVTAPTRYVTSTQSSSGGNDIDTGRSVMFSSPRARRAGMLLPASRSALRSTAIAIGMPFQCVISAPTTRFVSPTR